MLRLSPLLNAWLYTAYHEMRELLLFQPYKRPYTANHPEETREGNYRRVLLDDDQPIGTVCLMTGCCYLSSVLTVF